MRGSLSSDGDFLDLKFTDATPQTTWLAPSSNQGPRQPFARVILRPELDDASDGGAADDGGGGAGGGASGGMRLVEVGRPRTPLKAAITKVIAGAASEERWRGDFKVGVQWTVRAKPDIESKALGHFTRGAVVCVETPAEAPIPSLQQIAGRPLVQLGAPTLLAEPTPLERAQATAAPPPVPSLQLTAGRPLVQLGAPALLAEPTPLERAHAAETTGAAEAPSSGLLASSAPAVDAAHPGWLRLSPCSALPFGVDEAYVKAMSLFPERDGKGWVKVTSVEGNGKIPKWQLALRSFESWNVRGGPSMQAPVLAKVHNGEMIEAWEIPDEGGSGDGGGWLRLDPASALKLCGLLVGGAGGTSPGFEAFVCKEHESEGWQPIKVAPVASACSSGGDKEPARWPVVGGALSCRPMTESEARAFTASNATSAEGSGEGTKRRGAVTAPLEEHAPVTWRRLALRFIEALPCPVAAARAADGSGGGQMADAVAPLPDTVASVTIMVQCGRSSGIIRPPLLPEAFATATSVSAGGNISASRRQGLFLSELASMAGTPLAMRARTVTALHVGEGVPTLPIHTVTTVVPKPPAKPGPAKPTPVQPASAKPSPNDFPFSSPFKFSPTFAEKAKGMAANAESGSGQDLSETCKGTEKAAEEEPGKKKAAGKESTEPPKSTWSLLRCAVGAPQRSVEAALASSEGVDAEGVSGQTVEKNLQLSVEPPSPPPPPPPPETRDFKVDLSVRDEWVVGTVAAGAPWLGQASSVVALALEPTEIDDLEDDQVAGNLSDDESDATEEIGITDDDEDDDSGGGLSLSINEGRARRQEAAKVRKAKADARRQKRQHASSAAQSANGDAVGAPLYHGE